MSEVILVCSGPSLNNHLDKIKASPLPKFCVNNSIKLIEPNYWYAGDAYLKSFFPDWIWRHKCAKYFPDPKGEIAQFINPHAARRAGITAAHLYDAVNTKFIDVGYYYDRDSFFTSTKYQTGYAHKHKTTMLVNGVMTECSSSSMLPSIRLCVDNGYTKIILAGVDLDWDKQFYAYEHVSFVGELHDREVQRFNFLRNALIELFTEGKKYGIEFLTVESESFLNKYLDNACI